MEEQNKKNEDQIIDEETNEKKLYQIKKYQQNIY